MRLTKSSGGFLNKFSEVRLRVKQLYILFCAILYSLFSHRFQSFLWYLVLLLQTQEAERKKRILSLGFYQTYGYTYFDFFTKKAK